MSGSGAISTLAFSDGGWVDISLRDGMNCSGTYTIANFSETNAQVRSGHIQCPGLMNGCATTEFSLDGSTLVGSGSWGGRYSR